MKLALVLLALAGCTDEPPPAGDPVTSFVETKDIPLYLNTRIDLLFVIDSSPAMAGAERKLLGDYPAMVASLSMALGGELPDVHIGVTTADVLDQGRLRRGTFLSSTPRFAWRREANYEGPIADAFLGLAAVGTSGSARVQLFDAALQALSPAVNPGFVRPDANLGIVFLTTRDDQSATSVDELVRGLRSRKTDPSKVSVMGAFGACATSDVTATDAPRLAALVDQFPNRSAHATICDDLRPLMEPAKHFLFPVYGTACMEPPLATPYDCSSWLVDPDTGEELVLSRCSAEHPDHCWDLASDPQSCVFGDHLAARLRPSTVPFEAHWLLQCVVEPGKP